MPGSNKATPNEPIRFYLTSDDFGEFSNFAEYPIRLDGRLWPTTEHYFQAMKFHEKRLQEKVRRANSAMMAARIGRSRRNPLRRDWESVKIGVMRKAVLAKFTQHPELAELLRSTGDALIVEHTARDRFWGDGGDGKGRNQLGLILMSIRDELNCQETTNSSFVRKRS